MLFYSPSFSSVLSFTVRADPEAHMVHVSTPQSSFLPSFLPISPLFSFPLIAYSAGVVDLRGSNHMINGVEFQPCTQECI